MAREGRRQLIEQLLAVVESGCLRAEFYRLADRVAHRIVTIEGGERTLWLFSMEESFGSSPLSPPLQQVHSHPHPDGHISLLGLGMAGSSHWSLAVDPLTDNAGLLFDVACRTKERLTGLGSHYRCHNDPTTSATRASLRRPDEVALRRNGGVLLLRTVVVEGCESEVIIKDDSVQIAPAKPATLCELGAASTIRWRYHIQFFTESTA